MISIITLYTIIYLEEVYLVCPQLLYRLIVIRKRPTLLKLCCSGAVLLGLIISLIPIMSGDNSDPEDKQAWLQQPIAARVLWPLCFMFGFVRLLCTVVRH